MWWAILDSNQ